MDKQQNKALDNLVEDSLKALAEMPEVIGLVWRLSLGKEPLKEPEWQFRLTVFTEKFNHSVTSKCALKDLGVQVCADCAGMAVLIASSCEPR
jgi:hypothetical protein